jgi:hypothetical protein
MHQKHAHIACKAAIFLMSATLLSACSSSNTARYSGLATGANDPRYAHLYASMENNGYKNPVFSWVLTPVKGL